MTDLNGRPVRASWLVPRNQIVAIGTYFFVHPYARDQLAATDLFDRLARVERTTVRRALRQLDALARRLTTSPTTDHRRSPGEDQHA